MSSKHLDFDAAMRRLADRRIEEAMREGKFDNLVGKGQPLDLEPMPADENARLLWWAWRLMKNSDHVPDEVRYRKQIDELKAKLPAAPSEQRVRTLVAQVNALVRQLNTMGTNAIPSIIAPLSAERELDAWRKRHAVQGTDEIDASGDDESSDALIESVAATASPVPAGRPIPGGVRYAMPAARFCRNLSCRESNPATARFCRRCGQGVA